MTSSFIQKIQNLTLVHVFCIHGYSIHASLVQIGKAHIYRTCEWDMSLNLQPFPKRVTPSDPCWKFVTLVGAFVQLRSVLGNSVNQEWNILTLKTWPLAADTNINAGGIKKNKTLWITFSGFGHFLVRMAPPVHQSTTKWGLYLKTICYNCPIYTFQVFTSDCM